MWQFVKASALIVTTAATAETWTVDDDGPADFDNIQAAVDVSVSGDVISVSPGVYTGSGSEVVLVEGKVIDIVLAEGSSAKAVVDGSAVRRGITYVQSGGLLEGLTIVNGSPEYPRGGGIWLRGSSPTISECALRNNSATHGGGIAVDYYGYDSNPTILNCVIADNNAASYGGGIWVDGDDPAVRIVDCEIRSNAAEAHGGGIYFDASAAVVTGTSIVSNSTAGKGGGICVNSEYNTGKPPSIGNCWISQNTAVTGGAIHCETPAYVSACLICENSSPQMMGDWHDGGKNEIASHCDGGACCIGNQSVCVMSPQEDCVYFGGTFMGYGVTCLDASCAADCLGDVTGDGGVSTDDLLTVIANWGPCP